MQEQDNKAAELTRQNEKLKQQLATMESRLSALEKSLSLTKNTGSAVNEPSEAALEQNLPNPYNQSTVIKYSLPPYTNKGQLLIYNINGMQVKSYSLTGTGKGQIVLQSKSLSSGTYTYSLLVNGTITDTKTMIITR